jgi:hypothetical protein
LHDSDNPRARVFGNEYSHLVAFVFVVKLYYFALLFQAISPLAHAFLSLEPIVPMPNQER